MAPMPRCLGNIEITPFSFSLPLVLPLRFGRILPRCLLVVILEFRLPFSKNEATLCDAFAVAAEARCGVASFYIKVI